MERLKIFKSLFNNIDFNFDFDYVSNIVPPNLNKRAGEQLSGALDSRIGNNSSSSILFPKCSICDINIDLNTEFLRLDVDKVAEFFCSKCTSKADLPNFPSSAEKLVTEPTSISSDYCRNCNTLVKNADKVEISFGKQISTFCKICINRKTDLAKTNLNLNCSNCKTSLQPETSEIFITDQIQLTCRKCISVGLIKSNINTSCFRCKSLFSPNETVFLLDHLPIIFLPTVSFLLNLFLRFVKKIRPTFAFSAKILSIIGNL